MPMYAVRNKLTDKYRLVDALTASAALRHVAGDEYSVTIPKAREAAKLVADGVTVEDYGEPLGAVEPQGEQGQV